MSDYIQGWRRKLGLTALVMACVFCVGWVRSFYVTDTFHAFGGRFESHDESIQYYAITRVIVGRIAGGVTTMYWSVPYLSILIPLTLLSAYLLLSKQRTPGVTGGCVAPPVP